MSHRYLPHTENDLRHMLDVIGVESFDDLVSYIPSELRAEPYDMPESLSESETLEHYSELAKKSEIKTSFVGAGLATHHVPAAVDALISRGEFFTAYTPYQAEAAQGTLQSVFEFQTMVAELYGMDVANASMYDGASATAEAVLMALRLQRKRNRVILADSLHPDYIEVVRTYLGHLDVKLEVAPLKDGRLDAKALQAQLGDDVACLVVQTPNVFGLIEDGPGLSALAKEHGAKVIAVNNEPTAFALFASPGEWGADIAVGEGTGIGTSPSYGGPGVGLFATTQKNVRQMPGRLVGEALDAEGRKGYVLTLATREQHIRREKATSNICTNHGLTALAFTIHMALLGPAGLRQTAEDSAKRARYLKNSLEELGVKSRFEGAFFNEFVLELGDDGVQKVLAAAEAKGVAAGFDLGRWRDDWSGGLLVYVNEMHSKQKIDELVEILAEAL
ncbi:aminomethyl-transferring glycine dehydrogenase subunit GcvPA [Myxococcota bacterium]|nr:aminomethyl-transferring glycine dehydrogenase subunit GcvPA [Myxococcota bacterium]